MKLLLQSIAGIALMGAVAHAVLLDAGTSFERQGVVVASEPAPAHVTVYDRLVLGLMPVATR